MAADYTLGGIAVALLSILALTINTIAIVIFTKRRRLRRRAHLLPLFHVAVVDLLAVITWSMMSVVIAMAQWEPQDAVCQLNAYLRSLWNTLHCHSLAVLAIERAVRLAKPSRHIVIFQPRVVAFLIAGKQKLEFNCPSKAQKSARKDLITKN